MTHTLEEIRTTLAAAVEAKGRDYIYPRANTSANSYNEAICVYAEVSVDSKYAPSCIVGHLVAALEPEMFQHVAEIENSGYVESFGAGELLSGEYDPEYYADADNVPVLGVETENRHAIDAALSLAQWIQDNGGTWGEALDAFDEYVAEPKPSFSEAKLRWKLLLNERYGRN